MMMLFEQLRKQNFNAAADIRWNSYETPDRVG